MPHAKSPAQAPAPSKEKDDLYYGALVSAWLNTRLERDKSVFTLSAGGVGLLATLLMTVGPYTYPFLAIYAVATIAFAVALVTVLAIFSRNATHLKLVLRDPGVRDPLLKRLDQVSFYSFVLGALLLGIIGFAAGLEKVNSRMENGMSNSDQVKASPPKSGDSLKKSFEGISEMRPAQIQQPATLPPKTAPATTTPAASVSSQGTGGDTNKK